jgi:hypothetical protein
MPDHPPPADSSRPSPSEAPEDAGFLSSPTSAASIREHRNGRARRPVDLLGGFDDLVTWLTRAALLDAAGADAARARWGAAGSRRASGRRGVRRGPPLRTALRGMARATRRGAAGGR